MPMHTVLALMGPTAVGKTAHAIALAKALWSRFPIEIVSMDSALVYRGMDIGTGKPNREERAGIEHHLIDLRDPGDAYSAADFARDAALAVADIFARGRWPLLVGGTGLYFRAFRDGLSPLPPAVPELRHAMVEEAARKGWAALHARLAQVDPESARRIRPSDPQRIQRALEVHALTGTALSALQGQRRTAANPWRIRAAALVPADRAWLHDRIALRFEQMLKLGLEQEVRRIAADPSLSRDMPALRAVGYRQMLSYLDGEYCYSQMVAHSLAATRQLARRQLTWLRRETLDAVFDPCDATLETRLLQWACENLSRHQT